jgi:citrate synthase
MAAAATKGPWLTAGEASSVLGVSRATLYAYVSRGMVRSQAIPGDTRARGYARDDVERLRRRTEERRAPDKAAARTLQWGLPVLESAIALIDGQRLYYRGHDAVALATTRSLGEVASLIWTGRFGAELPRPRPLALHDDQRGLPFVARAQRLLAAAGAVDPRAHDGHPLPVAECGWRILHALGALAAGGGIGDTTIDHALAQAWDVGPRGEAILRGALILCADHELNVSSFTARAVASAGATPYAVVVAGLAALEGTRHGGASIRAEAMLHGLRRERHLGRAIAARVRRGDRLEGFDHPLYPAGDPRAAAILAWLGERYATSAELKFLREVARGATAAGHLPNLDFALAALSRVLALPGGAPLTIFALGRTIGWIGQAIEQYASGQLIRPRAKYVGVVPGSA